MNLSETIMADVQRAGFDAASWAKDVHVDKSSLDEVMTMFAGLKEESVREILARHNSNVDAAMSDLFALYEEQKQANKEQARRAQLEQTTKLLQRGFAGVERAIIEEVVARYGGDMELASQELLRIMAAQLERDEEALLKQKTKQLEARQDEERKLRAQIVDHCSATFDVLTRDEVQAVLRSHNYELPKAVAQLRLQSQARKLRNLQHVFSNVPEDHLKRALETTDYDLSRAFALLRGAVESHQAPPMAAEEDQLQKSLIQLNGLNSDDKDAQDLLADMLRNNAGPSGAAVPSSGAAAVVAAPASKDELLPASLVVALSAPSSRFVYGSSVEVTASVSGGEALSHDWVGLFDVSCKSNDAPLVWAWVQPGKPVVSLAFPAYGIFEARYLRKVNGEIRSLAQSAPLHCGPDVSMTVESLNENWVVHCQWDEKTEKLSSSAWVGLYAVGAANANYIAFQYLPAALTTLWFKKRQVNGSFEFRFFPYKMQGPLSFSKTLVVQHSDAVSCERISEQLVVKTTLASVDPAINKRVWVAVCFVNDPGHSKYRRSAYITKPAQSFEFKTPIHSGLYECRIYDENCKLLAKSNDFLVEGK